MVLLKFYYYKIMFIRKFIWKIYYLIIMNSGYYNSVLIDSFYGNYYGIFYVSIFFIFIYFVVYGRILENNI